MANSCVLFLTDNAALVHIINKRASKTLTGHDSYSRSWLLALAARTLGRGSFLPNFADVFWELTLPLPLPFFISNLSAKKLAPSKIVRLRFPSVLSCLSVPSRPSEGIRHSVTSIRAPEVTFGVSASIKIYGNYLSYLSGEVRELIPRSFLLVCFSFCFILFVCFFYFHCPFFFLFTSYKICSFSLTSFYDSFASLTV